MLQYVPYTNAEYDLMELVRLEDVLKVRAAWNSRDAVDDDIWTKDSVCFMGGIEHLCSHPCISTRSGLVEHDASEWFSQSRQGRIAPQDLMGFYCYCGCFVRLDKECHAESKAAR